jgi:S1 RNA binding domain protein
MLFEVGTVLDGRVTGITKFGAFVALPGGKSGMVHISEVANAYVSDIHDHLSEGQNVKVKVINLTPEGKINLSIKKAEEAPARERFVPNGERRAPRGEERTPGRPRTAPTQPREGTVNPRTADASFEDKLKQFMQEADSKMSGNRLYEQQRKGSRRRRD